MKVYLNKIDGIADAIVSMYMSKRTWTRELEQQVRDICDEVLDNKGFIKANADEQALKSFNDLFGKLMKWGVKHCTMLRYIDFSFTVEGLHRGAQDDFDSHARRLENRIIRSSTRLADYSNEKSDFYKGKIYTTDEACKLLGIELPPYFIHNSKEYVKTTNGYILHNLKDDRDVKRGLYMLSIPSNFIFKCNCTEFAHIIKERDINSGANLELKEMIESCLDNLNIAHSAFNRETFYKIPN